MTDWLDRKHKEYTRGLATDFSPRRFPLFMPAGQAQCLRQAEAVGMVGRSFSRPILVERNRIVAEELKRTLQTTGWDRQCLLHENEVHDLELPWPLDYVWLDLNGTVLCGLASWINNELSPNLLPGAVVCLTSEYCWRNNPWLKATRQTIIQNEGQLYTDFRFDNLVFNDKYIAFPGFLMHCLLRNWSLRMLAPYRYYDTIDMVFFRFLVVEHQPNPVFPVIVTANANPLFQGVTMPNRSVPTSSEVISAILNAANPAQKAHATRKLNAYVASKVKEGKSEKQVIAAIRAHVTRRRQVAFLDARRRRQYKGFIFPELVS